MSRFFTFLFLLAFLVMTSLLSLYWQIYSVNSNGKQQSPSALVGEGSEDRHLAGRNGRSSFEDSIVGKSSFEHSFHQRHLIDWKLFARALNTDKSSAKYVVDFDALANQIKSGSDDSGQSLLGMAHLFRAHGMGSGDSSLDFPGLPLGLPKSSDQQCTLQLALDLLSGVLEADIRALLISKLIYRYRLWRSLNPDTLNGTPYDEWMRSMNNLTRPKGSPTKGMVQPKNPPNPVSGTALAKEGGSLLTDDPFKLPPIYVVTATIHKHQQKADLTRLSQTLMLVPNLHWIVVEDSPNTTALVSKLLRRSGLSYTHLNVETPSKIKEQLKSQPYRPRGSEQRNKGIEWIRDFHQYSLASRSRDHPGRTSANFSTPATVWSFFVAAMAAGPSTRPGKPTPGVVYFADDDNSYDLQIFEEMRFVKKVGVWPVGLVGGLMVEKPAISRDGHVSGWVVAFGPHRPFALDMAGFAINLDLLLVTQGAKFEVFTYVGFVESSLLKRLVTLKDLEPLAQNCTKVYVWHTKTQSPELQYEDKFTKQFHHHSDRGIEV